MGVSELALIWKARREATRRTTRKKPAEWAFFPLAHAVRHGEDQVVFDALGDASIKPLPRVRILVAPPASPITRSPRAPHSRNEADFAGANSGKSTTKTLDFRAPIQPVRALSARFLRAMIVEWWFPMHLNKAPARCGGYETERGKWHAIYLRATSLKLYVDPSHT
jgi:hypothetical protein